MVRNCKVVTLCGSTRFKDEFMAGQKRLTLEGNIVISVGLFGHSGDEVVWDEGVKEMLDDMHRAKIDMADEISVTNPGGYIGHSTQKRNRPCPCRRENSVLPGESIPPPTKHETLHPSAPCADGIRARCPCRGITTSTASAAAPTAARGPAPRPCRRLRTSTSSVKNVR